MTQPTPDAEKAELLPEDKMVNALEWYADKAHYYEYDEGDRTVTDVYDDDNAGDRAREAIAHWNTRTPSAEAVTEGMVNKQYIKPVDAKAFMDQMIERWIMACGIESTNLHEFQLSVKTENDGRISYAIEPKSYREGDNVPDGWKLVPIKPTVSQIDGMYRASISGTDEDAEHLIPNNSMQGIGPRIYTAAIAGSPEYVGTAHQDDRMDAMDIFRQECGPEDDLPSPAHALIAGYEVYHNQNYGSTRLYGYKDAAERVAKETGGKCRTLYTAPPPARIAEPESVSAPTTSADIGKLCAAIITDVCELPDRTSPEDKPDHLIITATELEKIIRKAFAREWIEKKNG